jgi:hypothetical protein
MAYKELDINKYFRRLSLNIVGISKNNVEVIVYLKSDIATNIHSPFIKWMPPSNKFGDPKTRTAKPKTRNTLYL